MIVVLKYPRVIVVEFANCSEALPTTERRQTGTPVARCPRLPDGSATCHPKSSEAVKLRVLVFGCQTGHCGASEG